MPRRARLLVETLDDRINPSPAVSRLSSDVFYVDKDPTPALTSAYVGYHLQGDGVVHKDVYARIGGFSAGIGLATNPPNLVAPDTVRLGDLSAAGGLNAYFYLTGTVTPTPLTYTVTFFSGLPSQGSVLATFNETLQSVTDTLQAAANKFDSGSVISPGALAIGSTFSLVLNGTTGTIGSPPIFAYTPASLPTWLPSAFQLAGTSLEFKSTPAVAGDPLLVGQVVQDKLFYQAPAGASANTAYTITYTFRAINATTTTTSLTPLTNIQSGQQVKHTDTGSWDALPAIPAVVNNLTVGMTATPVSGGTSTLTLTVTNTGSVAASLDQLRAVLPAGVTYVAGSSTLGGAGYADPAAVAGGGLAWSDNYSVPVGGSLTLTFRVSVSGTGVYTLQGFARIGDTQIDTTAQTGDNAPATVTVAADATPPDTTLTATPPALSNSSSATFTFSGSDPGGSGVASFQYRLDGGTWTTATSPLTLTGLADGSHTFEVRAIDAVGNIDPSPASYTWTVDTTAPAAPAITGVSPDTGASPTDRVTNTGGLTVTGTAEAGSMVRVYDNGTLIGTTSANGSGNWSFPVTLAEGSHPLTARATDAAGNTSAATTPAASVVVDLTAPDTAIGTKPAALSGSASATFTFTGVDAGSGVNRFEYRLDGGAWTTAASPLTLTGLADGSHTFEVRAIDVAGNIDPTPAAYSWTVDTAAPAAPVVTGFAPDTGVPGDGVTSATTLTLTGMAEPGSTVTLFADGVAFGTTTTADAAGNWSVAGVGPLTAGPRAFTARSTDAAGNTSAPSAALVVTIDTAAPAAPAISGITPDTGASPTDRVTNTGALTVTGTAEAGSTVTVYDNGALLGTTTATTAGTWSLAVTLAEGSHPLTATSTDAAGNTSAVSATAGVLVDLTAPDTTISSQPAALSGSGSATFGFTGADGLSGVSRFEYSLDGGAWTTATSPLTLTGLSDGSHTFGVRAVDVAGNTDPTPASYTWTVDTAAPAAPAISGINPDTGASPTDRVTNTGSLTVSGTAEANSTVTVYDNGTPIGTTTANGSGGWSLAVTLAEGSHPLTAASTDTAGNVSGLSATASVLVDLTAPDTAISSQPTALSNSGTATFGFTGVDVLSGVSRFEARLDNGAWTTVTSPLTLTGLSDGGHTFEVRAVDLAGNTDPTPATYTWAVDTAAPTAPAISGVSPDTGASPTDRVTNTGSLTVSGTAEAGSTVRVFDNGALLGTATATAGGTWSLPTTLAEGSHPLTATSTDAAGNTSAASAPAGVLVDLTAPDTALTSQPAAASGSSSATFGFTGTDALSGVAGFEYSLDGGPWTAATGPLTLTNLSDGPHTFLVRAVDLAGNADPDTGGSGTTWTVDTAAPAAPAIAGVSPDTGASTTDRVTNTGSLIVSGTAEAGSTVTVFDNGVSLGTATANASGGWSLAVSLAPGSHPLTATATDAAGNTSAASGAAAVLVDVVAPAVGASAPAATNVTTPTVTVTASDASSGVPDGTAVAVDVDLDGNGDFAGPGESGYAAGTLTGGSAAVALPALAEGVYAYRVRLPDLAGNVGTSATGTVQVDTTTPDTAITSGPPATADTGTATFAFVGSDGGSGVVGFEVRLDGGNWVTATSPLTLTGLTDGGHTFEVRAVDAAGNADPTPATYTWAVDTGAPAAPAISGITPDTGASPTDRVTNTGALTVTGTAEANSTVAVYGNGALVGTTTATAGGTWSLAVTLAEGSYPLTATATDAAGNTSAASPVAGVLVDLTAPDTAISGQPPAIDPSATATFTFTGADALSGVVGFEYRLDGGPWTATPGTLTLTGLTDGSHTLLVRAVDVAGNADPDTGGSGYTWTIDTGAPAAPAISGISPDTGASPTDRVTNTGGLTIAGTAEANSTVTVSDGGTLLGTTTADANGDWTLVTTLTEATHPLTATATDAAGNTSGASPVAPVTVDTTPPGTTITAQPAAVDGSSSATFTFTGTDAGSGVAGFEYSLDGGPWTPAASPLTLTGLSDGTHTFQVRAVDVAGNPDPSGVASATWTVDTGAPAAPAITGISPDTGAFPTDRVTNTGGLTVTGTAEPNATVTVYDNGTPIGTTTADANGDWSLVTTLTEATHPLTATATDAGGNTSAGSTPAPVTVDTTDPVSPAVTGPAATADTTPTFAGTAEPGSTVAVYDGGTLLGTATADASGDWSFTPTTPLSEGPHTITTRATDLAGNTGPASAPTTLTVSTTVAVLPAVTPDWTVGGPDYPTRFEAAGTLAPFTFTVKAGTSLPPGLTLDPATGDVTGSPTAAGDFTFTVVATDAIGNPAERTFTIHVNPAMSSPRGDQEVLPFEVVQRSVDIDLRVVGGTGPIRYAVTAGELPPGLALDPDTGRVTGTPTAHGSYSFTVTATDGVNAVFSKDYRLDVVEFPLLTSGSAGPASMGGGTAGEIGTRVNLYGILDGNVTGTATPFLGFAGEVLVAYGDVTGDHVPEIIATAGAGGGPRVVVMDIQTGAEVLSFFAYDPGFRGGLTAAVGDLNGDGLDELVTGAGVDGAAHVKVFDGRTHAELASFLAFDPNFRGGARVAVADVTGDGVPDLIVGAGVGGGPHVKVFDGTTFAEVASWFAFEENFRGGIYPAAGDLYQTGSAVVAVGAGKGGGPRVSVFDGLTGDRRADFFAYDTGFAGGARVAVNDADHDGLEDLITGAGSGGGPHVRTWAVTPDGVTAKASFFAFDPANALGVYVG